MASVDVVIPNYNYGRYLDQCVESILTQGIEDLRILIIDNASTDNSVEVAREFASRDGRIEIVAHEKNLGYHASINEGVEWASSDYVVALCSDDLLAPGALRRAVSFMESHPDVSYVFGSYVTFSGDEPYPPVPEETGSGDWRIWDGMEFIERNCRTLALTVSPVVRTSAQKQAGYYRPELFFTDDLEMLLRLACYGRVAQTTAVQAAQRIHDSRMSRGTHDPAKAFREELALFDSFFQHEGSTIPRAHTLHRTATHILAKRAYWSAAAHLCRYDTQAASRLFRFAIQHHPTAAFIPPVDYLFQIERPLSRISNVLKGAFSRKGGDRAS